MGGGWGWRADVVGDGLEIAGGGVGHDQDSVGGVVGGVDDTVLGFADVFQISGGGIHPPCVMLPAGDFVKENAHRSAGVVVDKQVILASRGYQPVISCAVILNHRLVCHPLKIRESKPLGIDILPYMLNAGTSFTT